MTNRKFTPGGIQLAESTGVLLWDRDWIEKAAEDCGMREDPKSQPLCFDFSHSDGLLSAAVDVLLEVSSVSYGDQIAALQKQFNIGYARAARIIDEMEENGIVGPFRGSNPRDILITKEQWALIK